MEVHGGICHGMGGQKEFIAQGKAATGNLKILRGGGEIPFRSPNARRRERRAELIVALTLCPGGICGAQSKFASSVGFFSSPLSPPLSRSLRLCYFERRLLPFFSEQPGLTRFKASFPLAVPPHPRQTEQNKQKKKKRGGGRKRNICGESCKRQGSRGGGSLEIYASRL